MSTKMEANVAKIRAPRMTLGGPPDQKAAEKPGSQELSCWLGYTNSVPLQDIRWKNFPDPLTSQPCHLPTAAWIPNAALNPCPARRKGQSSRAVVLNDAAVSPPPCLYLNGNVGCFFDVLRGLHGSFPQRCAHFILGPHPAHILLNNPFILGHLPRTL